MLDWEMSTLGDPLADVGAMLAYWSEPGDDEVLVAARMMPPVTAAPGFPTRAQAVARYAALTGFDVSDIDWYQAFAYFKLALIELASGRIVKEVPVFASESRLGGDSDTGHPWDAMTPTDKVAALERLMKAEAPRAVAALLAP